jgi:hypothetical protein
MGLMISRFPIRSVFAPVIGVAAWLAGQQPALAQTLLAQTGGTKTAVGWLIVLLCIGLGLLVVCRPSHRKAPGWKKK